MSSTKNLSDRDFVSKNMLSDWDFVSKNMLSDWDFVKDIRRIILNI